jgi:hypothetical protein
MKLIVLASGAGSLPGKRRRSPGDVEFVIVTFAETALADEGI